ncbi:Class I SAM-dependent methyltransferase [Candidatus Magnetomoraceae bacterium gMMP-15]
MQNGKDFLKALKKKAKMFFSSAEKTYENNKEICSWLLDPLARWAYNAYGSDVFEYAAHGYAQYCLHVSQAQRKYEKEGRYTPDELPRIKESLYEDSTYMTSYMWAAILIYAFWESMVNHIQLFRDEFINKLPPNPKIIELACGHGVMGLTGIEYRHDSQLIGYDISPYAINIAKKLADASGKSERTSFVVKDVLNLNELEKGRTYQGVISAMLAEHLKDPEPLFTSISQYLAPHGLAFFSTALESPQPDHIYEFHKESEPLLMAENAGLRVERLICDSGFQMKGDRFLPRALAMVLRKL